MNPPPVDVVDVARDVRVIMGDVYRLFLILAHTVNGYHVFDVYDPDDRFVSRFSSVQSARLWIDEILQPK